MHIRYMDRLNRVIILLIILLLITRSNVELFQGKVSELKLNVHSSFKHKMKVKSLSVVGDDPRFQFGELSYSALQIRLP